MNRIPMNVHAVYGTADIVRLRRWYAAQDGAARRPYPLANARKSRGIGHWPRSFLLLACAALLVGCREAQPTAAVSGTNSVSSRALLEEATREFHMRSAEANGAERKRLLEEAATRYERLLKDFPGDEDVCAQAIRELGSIRALQGNTNEAVKLYMAVGERYPKRDWEVLMAWKSAADLLWDGNRREDARKFYAQIVERFGSNEAAQVVQAVVRGSKARLAE